jgi:hypothetical protein
VGMRTALSLLLERWYYAAYVVVMLVIGIWYGVFGSDLALIALRLSILPAIAIYGSELKRQRERAARRHEAGPRHLGLLFIVAFVGFGIMWLVLSTIGVL